MTPEQEAMLQYVHDVIETLDPNNAGPKSVLATLATIQKAVESGGGAAALPPDVQDAVKAIAAHLK